MAKILIVDDDVQLSAMLTDFLERKGHQVQTAGDPGKGMKAAREFKPDLVILDYHMPGDTGAHLFEAFRRNRTFEAVPVLFMSGSKPEEELLGEIASRGRTAFLKKGVPLDELGATIESLLKG